MVLTEKESEAINKEAANCVSRLKELGCDSAILFCTWPTKGGNTRSNVWRSGNYWAQRGHVQGWLEHERNGELADAIVEVSGEDEDCGL